MISFKIYSSSTGLSATRRSTGVTPVATIRQTCWHSSQHSKFDPSSSSVMELYISSREHQQAASHSMLRMQNQINGQSRVRGRMGAFAIVAMCFMFGAVFSYEQKLTASVGKAISRDKEQSMSTILRAPDLLDFDSAYQVAFDEVIADSKRSCGRGTNDSNSDCYTRKRAFPYKSKSGMKDSDRELIADLYFHAESVFEFGIGESTAIAAMTNLPRYAGVESNAKWIARTRSHVPDRFRFYFADVGPTGEKGDPKSSKKLAKMALDYQIAPLRIERDPFDIYFVDGRWRVACVMASFLHAIHSGGDMNKSRVVLHDYAGRGRPEDSNGIVESIATIEIRSEKTIVLAMRRDVTKADIFNIWNVSKLTKWTCYRSHVAHVLFSSKCSVVS